MATYVTSDAHGHVRALDAALAAAQPSSDDAIYVIGDMIDRGPDPVGVLKLVRSLPNARVLMGNHEQLMLDALLTDDSYSSMTWEMNGGHVTAQGLDALPGGEASEMVDWVASLPLFDVVRVGDRFSASRTPADEYALRSYILCHAGIDARAARAYLAASGVAVDEPGGCAEATVEQLEAMMEHQDPEDLLWIREAFWGAPTGLVDGSGRGPVVVAGHTPSLLLNGFARLMGGPVLDARGRARIVEVGACHETGGIADRIDIDASAAAGAPHGRVAVMRLEDHAVWYGEIADGE